MRRKLLIGTLLLTLAMTAAFPSGANNVGAQTQSTSYYTADCNAAGQGPGCQNTLYRDEASVNLQSWDPAHDHDKLGREILGLIYDTPVQYNGPNACSILGECLNAESSIASVDVANGTYYQFTIVPDIHAYRGNVTGGFDLGAITASDWVYSIERAVGECAADGPAPFVYPLLYNSSNWFNNCLHLQTNPAANQTALNKQFTDWLNSKPTPLGVISAAQWFVRADADQNATNGLQPFPSFLGILANSWAGVYPQKTMEQLCGALTSHLDMLCNTSTPGNLEATKIGIGTGPYIVDEAASTLTTIVLDKNAHYCDARPEPKCSSPAVGGPTHANRVGKIVFNTVTDERVRRGDLIAGRVDWADISVSSLPFFLNASTTPIFNALVDTAYWNGFSTCNTPVFSVYTCISGRIPDYNSVAYSSQEVDHAGLLLGPSPTSEYVAVNGHASPLWGACLPSPTAGCYVRRGIISALDYNSLLNSVFGKLGTQIAGFVPNGLGGNSTAAVAAGFLSMPIQNITMATEDFAAAGYNSSNPLTVTCAYNVESASRHGFCQLIASNLMGIRDSLGNAFVTTNLVNESLNRYVVDAFSRSIWDITSFGMFPDYFDQDDYARAYASPSVGLFLRPSGYKNSTLDSEVLAAATMPNGPLRDERYFDMQRTLNLNYLFIWMPQSSLRVLYLHDINGYTIRGTNPAFLAVDLDLTKSRLLASPLLIPNSLLNILPLIVVTSLTAMVLIRRTVIRKVRRD